MKKFQLEAQTYLPDTTFIDYIIAFDQILAKIAYSKAHPDREITNIKEIPE